MAFPIRVYASSMVRRRLISSSTPDGVATALPGALCSLSDIGDLGIEARPVSTDEPSNEKGSVVATPISVWHAPKSSNVGARSDQPTCEVPVCAVDDHSAIRERTGVTAKRAINA